MPPQDAYLESQILTADPLELVSMLYRAAGDATRSAKAHLAAGRIPERSHQITKAHAVLSQLCGSLDHTRGGTLSRGLARLYDYMQRRLLEANQNQTIDPLVEVEKLLTTLLEGWEQIRMAPDDRGCEESPHPPADAEPCTGYGGYAAVFAARGVAEYASQSWSL
ncbi:MAG: flagellar export chaperone FliS [Bryobacteraceae bacterium]|jgi:flagellar protein FliS